MRAVDLISKKKRGERLDNKEIEWLINSYVSGHVPDYQMSAFLMAVCFSGMDFQETADLTLNMMKSGDIVDLSPIQGVKVDKHSTGGVGDTTTLVVAPLVAALGGKVAKMSGRGLGHTGGTLDKLESIPGTRVEIPMDDFINQVNAIGVAVIGQSDNLVPADKKIYGLRDVTGTINSIPLIASSIMSKKLASGADAIVLDVKVGSGAFVETLEEAKSLAKCMVEIGKRLNKKVVAVITDMNQPLGLAVGNALEVKEAVELLSGKVKEDDPLYQVCLLLAGNMLKLTGHVKTPLDANGRIKEAIQNGSALQKLKDMIKSQQGDESYIDINKIEKLINVKHVLQLPSNKEGKIVGINAALIGEAAQILGAGREKKGDVIDPAVGLVMHKRINDDIKTGEPICTFYFNEESRLKSAAELIEKSVNIKKEEAMVDLPMVYDVVE